MMKRLALILVAGASLGAQDRNPSQGRLEKMLGYVACLERAEAALKASRPDEAVEHARRAIDFAVADSTNPRVELKTKGAAAHYLLACALSMKRDTASALLHLDLAAKNGFTDTERVRADRRLTRARMHAEFPGILNRLSGRRTDKYAGKTVADQKFGMGLIRARAGNFPRLGEMAPDFDLQVEGREGTLKLSSFRGKKPVVLVFGSYT